jgi:hypothetical protein
MSLESKYSVGLRQRVRQRFPGCVILRNDPSHMQGVPDFIVLFRNTWAMLEVKRAVGAAKQANQDHWIRIFGKMSFASFINPSNEAEVLDAMETAFGLARQACSSKS